MGSDQTKAYGAIGRTDMMKFDADTLVLIGDDETHDLFDERVNEIQIPDDAVQNMIEQGQLQPILVHREIVKNVSRVVVVDGKERVKTIRLANKILRKRGDDPMAVNGIWYKGDDVMGAMIAANHHRYREDDMSSARKIKRYIDKGHSIEQAANCLKATTATVKNLLALLNAKPVLQRAVENGLQSSAAYKIAKLPEEQQAAAVKEIMSSGKPAKGRELQRHVDKARGKSNPSQRMRSVKEWKVMKERIAISDLSPEVMALCEWALGSDNALKKYVKELPKQMELAE